MLVILMALYPFSRSYCLTLKNLTESKEVVASGGSGRQISGVQGQPGLQTQFQVSQGYIEKDCLNRPPPPQEKY